ncbi:MAG: MBL fold metallo-hydrolase [Rhodospirillales bacterium]|nr:MAG: MBL fold metallo-hydrolase [Rhodospirillales bacterium]
MTEIKVGAATVARVEESYEANFEAAKFFADWNAAAVAPHMGWLAPGHFDPATGFLKLSMHSWLIKVGGKTILIDSCVGNHKERPTRPLFHRLETRYMERFAATGVRPEQVDMVMCTHMHIDHVGWNTRLDNGRWVPTFPNARYIFGKEEYDHFLAVDRDPEKGPANYGAFRDSVLPVVEAGLAEMVSGAHRIDEHFSVEPAPGHTPGTVAVKMSAGGGNAVFCGDIVHHAIQVYNPSWNSFACADADNARKSRRKVLEHCAGSGDLLMPAHFGAPHACHIDSVGGGFKPRFV